MEKIADKLTQLLIKENVISDSMAEIYQYGLLRMLEIGTAVLTGFLICLSIGMIKEGIIFFVFFAPLRSYLGGIHLKKYWQCYIVSCLSLILVLLITRYMVCDIHITCVFIMFGVIGIGAAAKKEQKKQGSKAYSLIVWTVLAILLVAGMWCFIKGYDSILRLLCCIVILVFGSKLFEQVLDRKREKTETNEGCCL